MPKKGNDVVGRLALVQMAPKLGDLNWNLENILGSLELCRRQKAGVVLFPELALSGYFVKDLVSEVAVKHGSFVLERLAKASRGLDFLVGGVFEDPAHRFYNALFYFANGRLQSIHKKIYLPTYGMFDEGRYFDAGEALETFNTAAGPACGLICEDAWHAVLPLQAALRGAHLLLVASSSPARGVAKQAPASPKTGASELEGPGLGIANTWQQLNRVWALSCGLYVAFCNRVGFEDGVGFWGGSEVVDPFGQKLAQAPLFEKQILFAELEKDIVRQARIASPLLRDEKLDLDARLFGELAGWKLAAAETAKGKKPNSIRKRK